MFIYVFIIYINLNYAQIIKILKGVSYKDKRYKGAARRKPQGKAQGARARAQLREDEGCFNRCCKQGRKDQEHQANNR